MIFPYMYNFLRLFKKHCEAQTSTSRENLLFADDDFAIIIKLFWWQSRKSYICDFVLYYHVCTLHFEPRCCDFLFVFASFCCIFFLLFLTRQDTQEKKRLLRVKPNQLCVNKWVQRNVKTFWLTNNTQALAQSSSNQPPSSKAKQFKFNYTKHQTHKNLHRQHNAQPYCVHA